MIRNLALAFGLALALAAPVAAAEGQLAPPVIGGHATWYRADGEIGAAGPNLREYIGPNWRGSLVEVCESAHGKCVVIRLTDWCACAHGNRLVDLSDDAFMQLAPLSKGVIGVSITRVVIPKPPATDTAPAGHDTVLRDVGNAMLLLIGIIVFLVGLVALAGLEPYINSIMGWTDDHRSAKRRNKR